VQAKGPSQQLRISGIVKFGSVSTIGGATLAGFDLPTAQQLFDKPGKLDEIAVARSPGVATRARSASRRILPPDTQVDGAGAGARGREGHELVHLVPAELPARASAGSRCSSAAS
jgi:putative ABC transport system permease protein